MKAINRTCLLLLLFALPLAGAWAEEDEEDRYQRTIAAFKEAGESGDFFDKSYAYAVFPSIGRGGAGIGGARGSGRVFVDGEYVGDTTMTQLTIGLQLGGQVYSMIVFLEDQRAFDEFTSGSFEFGAQAKAVAITAGASAAATTAGSSAGVSGGRSDAATAGSFTRGMAVFTIARGGLMYEASIGGQKFSFTPKGE
jgi:lipid-binding SYLF domain-containing protein